ncbi:hypothetical protein LP416_24790 [Polaromonas sp. P2-4]|nr:hypothetical protein LP416_24790 [Polaromonas sp. P2-4]
MGTLAGLGLLIAALPVVIILIMSFSGGTNLDFPPQSLSLRWYGAAFDVLFGDKSEGTMSAFSAMTSSLIVGLITMVASVCVCVPLSYAVVRSQGRWRHVAELLFTLPIVFPLVVLGVAYLLMTEALSRETGVDLGLFRLAIPHITLALPFVLRNCLSAMSGVGGGPGRSRHVAGCLAFARHPACRGAADEAGHHGRADFRLHHFLQRVHGDFFHVHD